MSDDELTLQDLLSSGPMGSIPNPYPLFARLRRESPVVDMSGDQSLLPGQEGPGSVMLTRYQDVRNTLANESKAFSSAVVNRTMGLVMGPTIVGMDGPEHLKHRNLITPAMAPRALRGDFPTLVRQIADKIIDNFASKGSADLSAEFTFLYPLTVFVEILGLPAEDVRDFHNWGIDLTLVASNPEKGLAASQKMLEYLTPIVQEKRANPSEDLISKLTAAQVGGQQLTDFEVVSFLRLLVLAGAETTYHLMGSCFYAFLKDPELLERVEAERSLVPKLMDEVLRWESPISTVIRETVQETEVAGVRLAKGTNVLCHIGSANRDERQFENPDRLDIDRQDNEHISFGFGNHYCAGSRFALLESEIGINAVLDRLPNLRPQAGEEFNIIGFSFRGPDRLPAKFGSS